MSKSAITVVFLVFLISFCFFTRVRAEVIINEIVYAPQTGESEWLEIFNSGPDSVDLTDWRFFNNTEDSAPLRLQKGSATLGPGGYAVITSVSGSGYFSGTVLSSSQFSLPDNNTKYNTYKAVSDPDKNIIGYVEYDPSLGGAKSSGASLSLFGGDWKDGYPTPGEENQALPTGEQEESDNDTVTSIAEDSTEASPSTKKDAIPSINKTKILAKTPNFVGVPVEFRAENTTKNYCGKYFWNFGDGNSMETPKTFHIPEKYFHVYEYGGEYVVTLDCFRSYMSAEPEASDQIYVKIMPADVVISDMGTGADLFVEISNNTTLEADLSGWVLSSDLHRFVFPKNSIMKPKSKTRISSKITGFSLADRSSLKLLSSEGVMVSDYSALAFLPLEITAQADTPKKTALAENKTVNSSEPALPAPNYLVSPNLSAQALSPEIGPENGFNQPIVYFIVFLVLSAGATYFIRARRSSPSKESAGKDFEIIEG